MSLDFSFVITLCEYVFVGVAKTVEVQKNWRKIEKIDFHLDSDKYYPDQIKNLITYIEKYK